MVKITSRWFPTFRRNTVPSCSRLLNSENVLNMKAVRSFETSETFYPMTPRHGPEKTESSSLRVDLQNKISSKPVKQSSTYGMCTNVQYIICPQETFLLALHTERQTYCITWPYVNIGDMNCEFEQKCAGLYMCHPLIYSRHCPYSCDCAGLKLCQRRLPS